MRQLIGLVNTDNYRTIKSTGSSVHKVKWGDYSGFLTTAGTELDLNDGFQKQIIVYCRGFMVEFVGSNICSCASGLAAVPPPKENIVLMGTNNFLW